MKFGRTFWIIFWALMTLVAFRFAWLMVMDWFH